MADKKVDNPKQGKFNIENTVEMGLGDTELLKDLLSPETSTENPDDITDIDDEPKGKEEETKPEEKGDEVIKEFLYNEEEEEEEEQQEEQEQQKETEVPEQPESESSQFEALSKDLFKLGVFNLEEGEEQPEIKTADDFLKRFNEEKKKDAMGIVNNFIGQFGEDYQHAFDAIYVKGVNPKDYFSRYNEMSDFANMDLKKESNQEAVVRAMLNEQGLEQEDIDDEISTLKEYGDLEKKAGKFHKVLIKKQAQKLKDMEDESERVQQQKIAMRNEYVRNVQSILRDKLDKKEFDGIPVNLNLANELQDFLLVDKYKTASGETLTDFDRTILELKRPENHEKKVKIALILKMLEKDPTLSTIQRSGISKKSNELFGEVARQRTKTKIGSQQNDIIKRNTWSKL